MLKKVFAMLFGKKSSNEEITPKVEPRKVEDTYNYWADKQEVNYSSMHTAQDVLSTPTKSSEDTNGDTTKKEEEEKKSTSIGGWGCGGCLGGGCGGGCF